MKPLDVKTKFYNAESEDVYLEVRTTEIKQVVFTTMVHARLEPKSFMKSVYLQKNVSKRHSVLKLHVNNFQHYATSYGVSSYQRMNPLSMVKIICGCG
jgi:hypothetical protein